MSDLFLTKDDLKNLTGACKRPQQISFLRKINIIYQQNIKGDIVVSRNHVEQMFGVNISVDSEVFIEPDFSSFV